MDINATGRGKGVREIPDGVAVRDIPFPSPTAIRQNLNQLKMLPQNGIAALVDIRSEFKRLSVTILRQEKEQWQLRKNKWQMIVQLCELAEIFFKGWTDDSKVGAQPKRPTEADYSAFARRIELRSQSVLNRVISVVDDCVAIATTSGKTPLTVATETKTAVLESVRSSLGIAEEWRQFNEDITRSLAYDVAFDPSVKRALNQTVHGLSNQEVNLVLRMLPRKYSPFSVSIISTGLVLGGVIANVYAQASGSVNQIFPSLIGAAVGALVGSVWVGLRHGFSHASSRIGVAIDTIVATCQSVLPSSEFQNKRLLRSIANEIRMRFRDDDSRIAG